MADITKGEMISVLKRINAKVVWTSADIARRHEVIEAIIKLLASGR